MGVSSSAAIEVATLRALEDLSGLRLPGLALAHLAQKVENEFVGAPCGLMDQLTSAYGVPGALLPILCRPDLLEAPVRLPRGVVAVGWPSGVRHAVTASPYGTARTAAFMGKWIVEKISGRKWRHASELAPLGAPAPCRKRCCCPATMVGRDFCVATERSKIRFRRWWPAAATRSGPRFPSRSRKTGARAWR